MCLLLSEASKVALAGSIERADPDQVTRQIVGSYITEFARGAKQGAVATHSGQKPRQPRTINHIFANNRAPSGMPTTGNNRGGHRR